MSTPAQDAEKKAIDFLVTDLRQSLNDPDFPRWKATAEALFKRYARLRTITTRPLGSNWPGDSSQVVDEVLSMIERKITAAEEVLGLTD